MDIEIASFGHPVEVRSGGGGRRIGGYGAVFNRNSENLGGFVEKVAPTAFRTAQAIKFRGVVCRFNHQDNMLLGTTQGGTLRLSVDNTGLAYDVDLPECRGDVFEMVGRGDVTNSSFAFQTIDDTWALGDGAAVRTLHDLRLIDVAPVTVPAYPDATVGLRSLARHMDAPVEEIRDLVSRGEIRRLFTRSDRPSTPQSGGGGNGPRRLHEVMLRRYPCGILPEQLEAKVRRDVREWQIKVEVDARGPRPTRNGRAALLEIMGKKNPPGHA